MGTTARLASLVLLAARCLLLVTALQTGLQQGGRRGGGLWASDSSTSGDGGGGEPAALSDARSTMRGLVVDQGYPLEEHFVTTADGYVLGMFRIPWGASDGPAAEAGTRESSSGVGSGSSSSSGVGSGSSSSSGVGSGSSSSSSSSSGGSSGGTPFPACRPPVLLLHGVLDSSAAWVLNRPEQSLGFILADAGYDVWLGNSRGNTFSRNHTGLDPAKQAFWDFSWDEMAAYDVPAMVAYVLAASSCNASSLAFIGHSQGTTQTFAALASRPELRSQLSFAAMLAPAVHMRHIRSYPLQVLAAMDADRVFNLLGEFEFLPSSEAAAALFGQICRTTPLACASIITAVAGLNTDNMNVSRLELVAQFAPSGKQTHSNGFDRSTGTSVKNVAHWAQAIRKSRLHEHPLFQMYDYGSVCTTARGLPRTCNMRVYGQLEPPSYDLGAISQPLLAIFHGGRDRLADPEDVATLLRALPPQAVVYTQLEQDYEHIDFTWGIDARERIYPPLMQLLQRHHPASTTA